MHPTTSYQIATLRAAELRRRGDLRHAHAPARRGTTTPPVRSGMRSPLVQARAILAAALRGA